MQYSEFLKWSKGLKVLVEHADISLIRIALSELQLSKPNEHTKAFMERHNLDENELQAVIESLVAKVKEVDDSDFKEFGISPVFTDRRGNRSGSY